MANFKEEFEKMMGVTEYCLSVSDINGKINKEVEDDFAEIVVKEKRIAEINKELDSWFED